MTTKKQSNPFVGAEFTDVTYDDLRDPALWADLIDSLHAHDVVVVRSIDLTPEQQIELARRLGRPVPFVISKYRHPEFEEIMISSNEQKDGKPVGVARVGNFWHQDSTFVADPAPFTMLHGVNVPSTSGHTKFASAVDVYDRLPEEWKARLADRTGNHTVSKRLRIRPEHVGLSAAEFRAQAEYEHPPVQHPVVTKDERTGRTYVYGSREYMDGIEGFDPNENEAFFSLLDDLITDESHVYTHQWTPHDLVIWKTRTTYHIATEVEPGVGRTVHRVSIEAAGSEAKPVEERVQ
ncbi:TauD/TfdA dioxygenase family protein [Kitasatospora sp. NPDC086801]|uniref:TauD/TfdA dioxygenase family protein n=1 Tax=Kitasatospora sp. NPDC086801 TaxID=3364066 RepID=UPI003816D945